LLRPPAWQIRAGLNAGADQLADPTLIQPSLDRGGAGVESHITGHHIDQTGGIYKLVEVLYVIERVRQRFLDKEVAAMPCCLAGKGEMHVGRGADQGKLGFGAPYVVEVVVHSYAVLDARGGPRAGRRIEGDYLATELEEIPDVALTDGAATKYRDSPCLHLSTGGRNRCSGTVISLDTTQGTDDVAKIALCHCLMQR